MQISEDRVSHLAHKIIDSLWKSDLVDFPDEPRSLLRVKSSIADFFAADEEIDQAVRRKLASYSQKKLPGSREYEILYRKFYEEEVARRR